MWCDFGNFGVKFGNFWKLFCASIFSFTLSRVNRCLGKNISGDAFLSKHSRSLSQEFWPDLLVKINIFGWNFEENHEFRYDFDDFVNFFSVGNFSSTLLRAVVACRSIWLRVRISASWKAVPRKELMAETDPLPTAEADGWRPSPQKMPFGGPFECTADVWARWKPLELDDAVLEDRVESRPFSSSA